MTFELERGRSFENTERSPSGGEVDVTEVGGLRKVEAFPVFFFWILFSRGGQAKLIAPDFPSDETNLGCTLF